MSAMISARISARWARTGTDGLIRVGGAVAVVLTIEVLAGYFLWRGMTELAGVPAVLAWTLQLSLAGGSAVGTRAFHRGRHEDKWYGLATSIVALLFLVTDGSIAALQLDGLVHIRPGHLGVGVLVQCLIVSYLTVHTLMACPRDLGTGTEMGTDTGHDRAPESQGAGTGTGTGTTELGTGTELHVVRGVRTKRELMEAAKRLGVPRRAADTADDLRVRVEAAERSNSVPVYRHSEMKEIAR